MRALAVIQSQNICHCDLKPANILVDVQSKFVKICDFAKAKYPQQDENLAQNFEKRGDMIYRAPEVLIDGGDCSFKSDLWAVGCIIAEMMMGKPLFELRDNVSDQLDHILSLLGTPKAREMKVLDPQQKFAPNLKQYTAKDLSKMVQNK